MTLTLTSLNKISAFITNSISHGVYVLDGVSHNIDLFRKKASGDLVEVYIFLDDSVVGKITDVQLIDTDGEVFASQSRQFIKAADKGVYILFRYQIKEVEDNAVTTL